VSHYWFHDGERVDEIPLKVTGGRREGYRTWSHKSHFPGDPVGHWRVEVRTGNDQIIGVLRFEVAPGKNMEGAGVSQERVPALLPPAPAGEPAATVEEAPGAAPEEGPPGPAQSAHGPDAGDAG
jgi:hypothetical protein